MIYIFQNGDTLSSIAEQNNISLIRLITDNNLTPDITPSVGQAIMIVPPYKTYVVEEGDTIESVAQKNGISVLQLLRLNPSITDKNTLTVGEELVISYNAEKSINIMGYTSVNIQEPILRKSLPTLTYLTILNYRVDPLGNLQNINDSHIIKLALEYEVAPIMCVSTMTDSGRGSYAASHSIFNNPEIQDKLIFNMLYTMQTKGYMGLNLSFTHILAEDLTAYAEFVRRVTEEMNQEGYEVFVTITPNALKYRQGVAYENPYYAELGNAANYVILITYLWQEGHISDMEQTTPWYLKQYLDFVVTQIPPEKIMLGLTRIAYDWELPYIENESLGSLLTNASAISLANQLGIEIHFDQTSQTPFYYYPESGARHYVWFKDARTYEAILDLVNVYGLHGVAVWNIMYYYTQTWLAINSEFNVNTYDRFMSEM
jgi:spore germination protein